MQNAIVERRVGGRFKIEAAVRYGLEDFERGEVARGKDLGFKGVRLIIDKAWAVGVDIYVIYDLPDSLYKFRGKGKVVWIREIQLPETKKTSYEIGVNFYIVYESDKDKLYNYLHSNRKEELMSFWWRGLK